jgi:transcriptional regulator with XRE-family HTH domain
MLFIRIKYMKSPSHVSSHAQEALGVLASMIRAARMQRGMTSTELATRTGVSRGVIQRLEAAEPGTAIGTAFEAAVVLGIPLFDTAPERLATLLDQHRKMAALLPQRAFQASQRKPENDF